MNKTIPKKKKSNKAKWLSEEGLQIAEDRREAKSKGEKDRYTQLKADFQRTAQSDKMAFFNEQCRKQQMGKDERSLQENLRYQGNILPNNEYSKGHKLQRPSRW